MDQTRALTALAPYLALAKSATSPRAAIDLITQATSAPNTYVFAELLEQPNIHAIRRSDEYGIYHYILEIFAWGTWQDYKADASLPPLSEQQTQKLKLLSLLSYAAAPSADLGYAALTSKLDLSSTSELESLVTIAIYNSLLTATLNPSAQTVVITSVAPLRDLAPGSIASLLGDLNAWSQRCDSVLSDLQAEIANVEATAQKKAKADARREKQVSAALEEGGKGGGNPAQANSKGTRSGNRKDEDDDADPMDVDGGLGGGGGKKRGTGVIGGMFGKMGKSSGR
ncbi:hypothetical protein LTR95_015013 [Oleoguttula sp. CCFEE 5521]